MAQCPMHEPFLVSTSKLTFFNAVLCLNILIQTLLGDILFLLNCLGVLFFASPSSTPPHRNHETCRTWCPLLGSIDSYVQGHFQHIILHLCLIWTSASWECLHLTLAMHCSLGAWSKSVQYRIVTLYWVCRSFPRYTVAYTCIHHRIQLAVGDMTMSGWKPTISLIHLTSPSHSTQVELWSR